MSVIYIKVYKQVNQDMTTVINMFTELKLLTMLLHL